MRSKTSDRRLEENEANFRQINERVHEGFKQLNATAREDRQPEFRIEDDMAVDFFCECSNIECRERIRVKLGDYERIHKDRKEYTVRPGHEILAVEEVVSREPDYIVVRKLT